MARVGGATLTTPTANSVPDSIFDPVSLGVGKRVTLPLTFAETTEPATGAEIKSS